MDRLSTIVNDKVFYYSKIDAISSLKLQQKLIVKVNFDKEIIAMISEIDLEDKESSGTIMLLAFIRVLQTYEPDELINFMQEVITLYKIKIGCENGEQFVSINRDFEGNFNSIFNLMYNVISENYKFNFFLTNKPSEEKKKNSVKVQPGQHI